MFRFYTECLLSEIIDPLYGKRMLVTDIREPTHILEEQKKYNALVASKISLKKLQIVK